jgi:esterase
MAETLTAARTGIVKSDGLDIFYRALGRPGKTPILIVHGLSYFSYDWIEVGTALGDAREVVAMDMRGFGNSSWSSKGAYKVQDFGRDILAVLDHFGWPKAILMGHSMGGRNSTYTAAAHPERFEKVVLVDWSPQVAKEGSARVTNTVADMPKAFADLDTALRHFKLDPAKVSAKTRARYQAYLMPGEGGLMLRRDLFFREQFRRVRDEGFKPDHGADLWDCLKRVACPILVLRGRRSDMFAAETAEKMKAANPRVELVELEGGHDLAGDASEGLIAAVRRFAG